MGPRRAAPCLAALMLASGLAACSPDDPIGVAAEGGAGENVPVAVDGPDETTTTHAPFPTTTTGPAASTATTAPPATVTTTRSRPAPTTTTKPTTTTTAAACAPSRPFQGFVRDLAFDGAGHGLAGGTALRLTEDGGRTWAEPCVAGAFAGWVHAVDVKDGHAWAVGIADPEAVDASPVVLRSSDGGRRWAVTALPVAGVTLDDIAFADTGRGVVVGHSNAYDPALNPRYGTEASLFRTQDGGLSWHPVHGLPEGTGGLRRVSFVDERHGWALGQTTAGAPVLVATGDAGATWTARPVPPGDLELRDVVFTDPHTGWLAAVERTGADPDTQLAGVIYSTTDGGLTWERPFSFRDNGAQLWDLDLLDGHVFAVGQVGIDPVLFVSGDGGATWDRHAVPGSSHTTVDFVDPAHGWVTGMRGTCTFATSDGGRTWSGANPGTGAPCDA